MVVAVLAANDAKVMNGERLEHRTLTGTLSISKGRSGERMHTDLTHAIFKPNDTRLPSLLIPRGDLPLEFVQDPFGPAALKIYEAKLDTWPENQASPNGRLLRVVGEAGEISSETQVCRCLFFAPAMLSLRD